MDHERARCDRLHLYYTPRARHLKEFGFTLAQALKDFAGVDKNMPIPSLFNSGTALHSVRTMRLIRRLSW